jgi:hypothetical protein
MLVHQEQRHPTPDVLRGLRLGHGPHLLGARRRRTTPTPLRSRPNGALVVIEQRRGRGRSRPHAIRLRRITAVVRVHPVVRPPGPGRLGRVQLLAVASRPIQRWERRWLVGVVRLWGRGGSGWRGGRYDGGRGEKSTATAALKPRRAPKGRPPRGRDASPRRRED